jgi:hypothetical protein
MSLDEEPSPVRQVSDETHYDLNVEYDGYDQLANIENLCVHRADVHSPRRLEDERGKSECYPTPPDILIYLPHRIPSRFTATRIGPGGPCLVLLVNDGLDAIKEGSENTKMKDPVITHGAAQNALECVSVLIAENVFVITATNKLISQKLSTIRQVMKKKQDMKNSESITLYINVAH